MVLYEFSITLYNVLGIMHSFHYNATNNTGKLLRLQLQSGHLIQGSETFLLVIVY